MVRDEDIALVKQSVTMGDIAKMYGYEVTRSGFMKCCFHPDNKPSMKVYPKDKGYHCFVCHSGGDIVDFVMRHDNLEFEPAVRLIADHFGIAISDGKTKLSVADRKRIDEAKAKREAAEKKRRAYQERLRELSDTINWLKNKQAEFEPLGAVWVMLQKKIEKCQRDWDWLFDWYCVENAR